MIELIWLFCPKTWERYKQLVQRQYGNLMDQLQLIQALGYEKETGSSWDCRSAKGTQGSLGQRYTVHVCMHIAIFQVRGFPKAGVYIGAQLPAESGLGVYTLNYEHGVMDSKIMVQAIDFNYSELSCTLNTIWLSNYSYAYNKL